MAAKTYTDFLAAFDAGVNGGIEPLLLSKNQLARAENATVRGAYISHRPPKMKRDFIFASPLDQTTVETGLFQGGGYYRPDYGTEQLVAQISGHLFSFTEAGGKFTVADISIAGDLNDANNRKVWMWQAEKWLIISDGTGALPIFYDGVSSRRSMGDSVVIGSITATSVATPPAIGGVVTVTIAPAYSGPYHIPVLFNHEFYEIYAAPAGANAQLTNINGNPGDVVPHGSQIIVNPNFIGYTVGDSTSTYANNGSWSFCPGPGYKYISWLITLTMTMESIGAATLGDSVTIMTNVGMVNFTISNITGNVINAQYTTTTSSLCSGTPPPPTVPIVAGGTLVQFTASHGPTVVIANTTADFTNPATGAIVTTTIDIPYSGPANQTVTIGASQYFLTAIAPAPVGPTTTLTLKNLTDVATGNYTLPQDMLSVPELPACRMGEYGQARVWYSGIDGITFGAGDIVGGPSGSAANDYRDSVLKTTEQTFLPGGGTLRLPTSGDTITAMIFPVVLDNSLGQGPLQIGTQNSMFSVNLPVDRTTWTSVQLILPPSLIGKGPMGQASTIVSNSDVTFRAYDGTGSLVQARRDFTSSGNLGGGNTPISREVSYIYDLDDQSLLMYGSAMTFDNRELRTYAPSQGSNGIVHSGLVSLNFDAISNLRTKLPSAYEGAWTDLNILKVIRGQINGIRRAFAFVYNSDTQKIELIEFLASADTQTLDNGTDRISWNFDTPIIFNKDIKPLNELVKLSDGEIYTKEIDGVVDIEVQYRPDFTATWTTWHKFSITPATWKPRMGLGQPSVTDCEVNGSRSMRVGYFFQCRVIITGNIKFMGLRASASVEPETTFANPICTTI